MSLRLVPGTAKSAPPRARPAPDSSAPVTALRVIDCRPDLFESLRQNGSRPKRPWRLAAVVVVAATVAAVILLAR